MLENSARARNAWVLNENADLKKMVPEHVAVFRHQTARLGVLFLKTLTLFSDRVIEERLINVHSQMC